MATAKTAKSERRPATGPTPPGRHVAEYRYMEKAVYRQFDMDAARTGLPREPFLGIVRFGQDGEGNPTEHVTGLCYGTLRVLRRIRLRDIADKPVDDGNQPATPGRPADTLGSLAEVEFQPPDPVDPVRILIDLDELDRSRDLSWTRALGMQGYYDLPDLPDIKRALLAMITAHPLSDVYTKTGVLVRDDLPDSWVRMGRPALLPAGVSDGFDPSAIGMVPLEFREVECLSLLDYADPSTPVTAKDDAQALLDIVTVWPEQPHVPAVALSLLAWAPWSSFHGRAVAIIVGKSAEFAKTTLAGQLIAYQSGNYLPNALTEPPVIDMRGKGTALGLAQAMHTARGAVVSPDDLITKHMSAATLTKQLELLDGVVSQVRTGRGHPRGGMRSGGRTAMSVNKAPTGCALLTLEELPNESRLYSLVGRAAVVRTAPVPDPIGWGQRMTRAQQDAPRAAAAYSGYIAWLLADWRTKVPAALADARSVVAQWRAQYGGHKNTVKTYGALLAGAWLLTEYARSVGAEPAEDFAALLERAFSEQSRRSGEAAGERAATDPDVIFGTGFRALLNAAVIYLADPSTDKARGYVPPALEPAELVRSGWEIVTRLDMMGAPASEWRHPKGSPAGAVVVHAQGSGGKPPVYPRRILVTPVTWDQVIVPAVRAWAQDNAGVLIPDGPELRDVLVRAGVMYRADSAPGSPAFLDCGTRRRYVLDFDRLVMVTDDTEPDDDADQSEQPAPAADPSTDIGAWVAQALSVIPTMTAEALESPELTAELDAAEDDGRISSEHAGRLRAARIRRQRELAVSIVPAPRKSPEPAGESAPATAAASTAPVRRPAARQPQQSDPTPERAATAPVYVVSGGQVTTAAGETRPAPADLPALLLELAPGARGESLVIVTEPKIYGITGNKPAPGKAWHKGFTPADQGGWHAEGDPKRRPHVGAWTNLAHPDHGTVRLCVLPWLATGDPFPLSRAELDAGETPAADVLAARLERFHTLMGQSYRGTRANSAVRLLRDLMADTTRGGARYQGSAEITSDMDALDWVWRTPDLAAVAGDAARVHGFDGNKNHLYPTREVRLCLSDLEHTGPIKYDPKRAGLFLIDVPEWPYLTLPAPTSQTGRAWVTAPILKRYVRIGFEIKILESLSGPGVQPQGTRRFVETVAHALTECERAGETAVGEAAKGLYQTLHGKLRAGSSAIRRQDWGLAIRDESWCSTLDKVYRIAGLEQVGEPIRGAVPVYVDMDEIVYPSSAEDHADTARKLGGVIAIGRGLGQFKVKTDMSVSEWTESQEGEH